jgi:hypothetical protein
MSQPINLRMLKMSTLLRSLVLAASLVALTTPSHAGYDHDQNDIDKGIAGVMVYSSHCPGGEAAVPFNAKQFIMVYSQTRAAQVVYASRALMDTIANVAGGDFKTGINLWCHIMKPKVGPIFDNMSRIPF